MIQSARLNQQKNVVRTLVRIGCKRTKVRTTTATLNFLYNQLIANLPNIFPSILCFKTLRVKLS